VEVGVRLTVVPTQGEAEVICGLLRANGIPCAHREVELASQAFGGWWNEILVPENRLAEARELVEPPDTSEPPGEI
jgi:Putative prokaryotic signal transducing protein